MRFGWLDEKRSWMKHDGFWFRSMQSSSVILSNCTGVVCWNIGFCGGGRLNVRPPPPLEDAGAGLLLLACVLLFILVFILVFEVAAPRRELKSKPPEGILVLLLVTVTVGLLVLVAALVVLLLLVFGIMTIIKSPFAIPTEEIGLSP